jgi:GNAT superfamily N-acetyltransferase/nitroimidazol reductase NimA-like FMN-containing flavoprotein (pyridoxamine 5'-phosphate oxidase superfamily)
LNGVLVEDWILFHGALAGEKMDCCGQPAVVGCYEQVATIPSYFFDPRLACPATTYFKSAMAHGTLRRVQDAGLKSRMLQALMEKYQPEGGHAHFINESELYVKELKSVQVFGLQVEELTGKINLGHDRPSERTRAVVEGLYERGAPGDLAAIETILEYSPDARPPYFSRNLRDVRLTVHVHPSPEQAEAHARLLAGQYWRTDSRHEDIVRAILCSQAWVGVCDETGKLVAAARAATDKYWAATIFDVIVDPQWRREGLGKWLMESLLAHPEVRECRKQRLGTLDAQAFYERFGFTSIKSLGPHPVSEWLVRKNDRP